MAKKSLILYASMTGNTEKVVMRFQKIFEKKGWECDIIKANKYRNPVNFDNYDLICVGSPVIAGAPARDVVRIIGSGSGAGGGLPGAAPPGSGFPGGAPPWSRLVREPDKVKKGVAFVTYTGDRRGPPEALPSLGLLELYMEDQGFKCVGKFACPGRIWRKSAVDKVASKMGLSVEDASGLISRYKENPDDPEFSSLSKEDRATLDAAIATQQDEDPMWKYQKVWHWDVQNRPSERDLTKAEIFLEEILEDYYEDGLEVAPVAQYLCIA